LGQENVSRKAEAWLALKGLPNVHCLGRVHAHQVPGYVKGFDVGLMPYAQNRHAEYISPIKLYDYLAAGIPVASLAIPAVNKFEPYVQIAATPADFVRAVRNALQDTSPERHRARRAVAAQHSWQARVEQLSEIIQTRLEARQPQRSRKNTGAQTTPRSSTKRNQA
jgi:glycosyltransferase involved in cell wall biosynthesis